MNKIAQSISIGGFFILLGFLAGQALGAGTQPVLIVSPLVITQVVDKGANPTGEFFSVWNGATEVPSDISYRVTVANDTNGLIQGLAPTNGINSGAHDVISIYFKNLSAFSVGSYTALVSVAATNYSGYVGNWSDAATVTVVIAVATPDAPANLSASKGVYDDRVALSWAPGHSFMGGAVTYNVLRYQTFDPDYADTIVSGISATNFDDLSAQPGLQYYYWVQCANVYGEHGTNGAYESGYRRLPAPVGIFATDGEYANKVRVTWSAVDGASSYYVYRSGDGASGIVWHTSGTEYEDNLVAENVSYTYQVQATNMICASDLSAGESGYVLSHSLALSASAGLYVWKIRVSWAAVPGATIYEVWRSLQPLTPPDAGAIKIVETTATTYDDAAVSVGTKYYYWVKAKNTQSAGNWSVRGDGYAASGSVALSVWGLVAQPRRLGIGAQPRVVSFRLANTGAAPLTGDNGTLRLTFYASTNAIFGAGDTMVAAVIDKNIALNGGSSGIICVNGSSLDLPDIPGSYYLFLKIAPAWPSLLAPTSVEGWMTRRTDALEVSEHGTINYQAMNDYNGDGISDMTVNKGGVWDSVTEDGYLLASGFVFGGSAQSVMGDYDGDAKTDPIVYDESRGAWQALMSGSSYTYMSGSFGGPWLRPVPGDYNGDGRTEVALYDMANSLWYAMKAGGSMVMWGLRFGSPGYDPVIGDYDGDGVWDLAVYDEQGGLWFIRTISGTLIFSGERWGGYGFRPVPGDYDGDGISDMALYNEASGRWYIRKVNGQSIASGVPWGGPGYRPVQGDFDGDAVADLAVYSENTGKWFIRTVSGAYLLLDATWGGPGHIPVGAIDE